MIGIDAIAGDLQRSMEDFIASTRARVKAASESAANAARASSSPFFGVSVDASVAQTGDATKITVRTERTDAPGTVFGGVPYATSQVAAMVDKVLKEAGLDRTG